MHRGAPVRWAGPALVVLSQLLARDARAAAVTVRLEDPTGAPIAGRVRITDGQGLTQPFGPDEVHMSHGSPARFFYVDGEATFDLPLGLTTVQAARGFEWAPRTVAATVVGDTTIEVVLTKVFDQRSRGYWSGDTHVHTQHPPIEYTITPERAHAVARAEDLSIMWCLDQAYEFTGAPHPLSDAHSILYYTTEYRNQVYGHVALLGLHAAVPLGCCWPGSPPAPTLTQLHAAWGPGYGQAMILSHPVTTDDYWGDEGTWPTNALGRGLATMGALGALDALDLAAYSADPDLFVQDWYALLDAGVRVPASAGTDATIDDFWASPAGGYRVYVQEGASHDAGSWVEGLRHGRTYVTNYPLVPKFTVDGQLPGSEIAFTGGEHVASVNFRIECVVPVDTAEVVLNGVPVATFRLQSGQGGATIAERTVNVSVTESSWIAVRARGVALPSAWFPVTSGGVLFAHTSPVYLVRDGEPMRSTLASGRLLGEIDDLEAFVLARGVWDGDAQRDAVLSEFESARGVYGEAFVVPPGAFDLVSPALGDTISTPPFVTLDWTDALDEEPGDRLTYDVAITPDSTFTLGVTHYAAGSESELAISVTQFAPWLPYYWRVVARDLGGNGTLSLPVRSWFIVSDGAIGVPATSEALASFAAAPNPATTRLALRFAAPIPRDAAVRVLDVRGREVASTATDPSAFVRTGPAEIQWDLTGSAGVLVPNGRFWVELSAGDGSRFVRPILVVR